MGEVPTEFNSFFKFWKNFILIWNKSVFSKKLIFKLFKTFFKNFMLIWLGNLWFLSTPVLSCTMVFKSLKKTIARRIRSLWVDYSKKEIEPIIRQLDATRFKNDVHQELQRLEFRLLFFNGVVYQLGRKIKAYKKTFWVRKIAFYKLGGEKKKGTRTTIRRAFLTVQIRNCSGDSAPTRLSRIEIPCKILQSNHRRNW